MNVKYNIGDVFNNRKYIERKNKKYVLQCLDCGKITLQASSQMTKKKCPCRYGFEFTTKPLNPKLSAIRDKYKNGVTIEHIKEMLNDN